MMWITRQEFFWFFEISEVKMWKTCQDDQQKSLALANMSVLKLEVYYQK